MNTDNQREPMNSFSWTSEDQQRVDHFVANTTALVRDHGIDPIAVVIGHIEAAGVLMLADAQRHPDRLRFYLTAIQRLADHIAPVAVRDDGRTH